MVRLAPRKRRFLEHLKDAANPLMGRRLLIGGEHLGVKFALIGLKLRRHAEDRRDSGDDFATTGAALTPAVPGCSIRARAGLVQHHQHDIFRGVGREGGEEARQQRRGRIAPVHHLLSRAGLAADR